MVQQRKTLLTLMAAGLLASGLMASTADAGATSPLADPAGAQLQAPDASGGGAGAGAPDRAAPPVGGGAVGGGAGVGAPDRAPVPASAPAKVTQAEENARFNGLDAKTARIAAVVALLADALEIEALNSRSKNTRKAGAIAGALGALADTTEALMTVDSRSRKDDNGNGSFVKGRLPVRVVAAFEPIFYNGIYRSLCGERGNTFANAADVAELIDSMSEEERDALYSKKKKQRIMLLIDAVLRGLVHAGDRNPAAKDPSFFNSWFNGDTNTHMTLVIMSALVKAYRHHHLHEAYKSLNAQVAAPAV